MYELERALLLQVDLRALGISEEVRVLFVAHVTSWVALLIHFRFRFTLGELIRLRLRTINIIYGKSIFFLFVTF